MDDAHGVLNRDALESACAAVFLGPPQAGKDERIATVHEMAAVKFRADLDREVAVLQSGEGVGGIRSGESEVAAHADEDLHVAAGHGWNHANRVQT